jgi:hypothetical protein
LPLRRTPQVQKENDVSRDHEAEIVSAIARAIHRYVIAYPDAADTIEGIHRWWLTPPLHEEPEAYVEEAVAYLVANGTLRQTSLEDGRVIFSNAQRRP